LGEESPDSLKDIQPAVQPSQVSQGVRSFVQSSMLEFYQNERRPFVVEVLKKVFTDKEVQTEKFTKFNTANAAVWVDPLDGTKDFVNGNLASVTVLIGLTIDEHSRFGIVHNPFCANNPNKGATFFGSAEHGCFTVPYEHSMSTAELL
jgi:3'-phosphoadenosine 5'-phosphosulfate (PAPS) 3'-phosphatase